MPYHALIDADILVYRVGFASEDIAAHLAMARMDESIQGILDALNTSSYQCFLTSQDHSNFRFEIYPEYKAGRGPKPIHYGPLRDHLVLRHKAVVVEGEEADDRLGIVCHGRTSLSGDVEPCICSIDKDLDQIPGWHFNFVKGLLYRITPEEGIKKFYTQLLMGDRIDNIPCIRGIGPKKAKKILEGKQTEEQMYDACLEAYKKHNMSCEDMHRFAKLLHIRKKEGEVWQSPRERNLEVPLNA